MKAPGDTIPRRWLTEFGVELDARLRAFLGVLAPRIAEAMANMGMAADSPALPELARAAVDRAREQFIGAPLPPTWSDAKRAAWGRLLHPHDEAAGMTTAELEAALAESIARLEAIAARALSEGRK